MKPKNIKEFCALIHRYETITPEEVEEAMDQFAHFTIGRMEAVKGALTGFGTTARCTLCAKVQPLAKGIYPGCHHCVYGLMEGVGFGCLNRNASDSYYMIKEADTAGKLIKAYRARAKYMRTVLEDRGIPYAEPVQKEHKIKKDAGWHTDE